MDGSDITASHIAFEGTAIKGDVEGTLRDKRLNYRLALDLTDLSRLAGTLARNACAQGIGRGADR